MKNKYASTALMDSDNGIPYTIIYENKEFYQLADNRGHSKVFQNLHAESETVKALFGRSGPNYYCPCPPFIWSSKVWQSFDKEYLEPQGMTFWDYSKADRPETLTYLEALLKFKAIPIQLESRAGLWRLHQVSSIAIRS